MQHNPNLADNTDNSGDNAYQRLISTLYDLLNEHGSETVLEAIADYAQFESEDEENTCNHCRQRAARLHLELTQLVERMDDFSMATLPEAKAEEVQDGTQEQN
jgi:hypothetical protein